MDDFKGVVKIDFTEPMQKSGFTKDGLNSVFKELNYGFTYDDVASGNVHMTQTEVDSMMGICKIDPTLKGQYYAKYTTNGKTQL